MDSKYLLSKGIYKGIVNDMMSIFNTEELIDIFTGSEADYHHVISRRATHLASNRKGGVYGAGLQEHTFLNMFSIREYIRCTDDDDERMELIELIRHYKDIYGFLEIYLKDFDYAEKLSRIGIPRITQRIVNQLRRNKNQPINLYFFHPEIYLKIEWSQVNPDITESIIEYVDNTYRYTGIANTNTLKAIELIREYYLSQADPRYKELLYGTSDVIVPDLWDNLPPNKEMLDMLLHI